MGSGMTQAQPLGRDPVLVLEARNLSKSFGATLALDDVDFALRPGEIVAVTGPSGSGKSTLLLCLSGILTPDGGQVVFESRRVDSAGEAERSLLRRSDFGVLFQFGQLVPELTATENVALPLLLAGKSRREALGRANDWLLRLDVGELGSRRPAQLSGGQAQRVALARAMVTGPRVVFADEPTGSLDQRSGDQVIDVIVESARDTGVAVVLVTHDSRIASRADRRVAFCDGRPIPAILRPT